jgi:hypothetical protein
MAVDYQVVFPVEVIKLNALRFVFGSNPPVLDINGQDFRAVDDVVINDQKSLGWAVLSKTRMLAILPAGVAPALVSSINITSRKLVVTDKSILKFQISTTPAKATGILRLMQLYVKLMLTTPGSDIFDKKTGGGILRFLGSTSYGAEGGDIVRRFVVSNDLVSRQIITIQSRQPSLPPDEKLLAAKVLSARFSRQQSALLAATELTTQAGRSAITNLVF